MTIPPREHLKSSIEAFEPQVQNDIELFNDDRVTEERQPSLLGSVARNARNIGFYHTLIDDEVTVTVKEINDNRYYWQCRNGDSVNSVYKGLANPDE
jgi:hypothetical protein